MSIRPYIHAASPPPEYGVIAPSRSPSTPAASPARTEPDERLLLAHTHGDRLRLRATLAYLNARVEPGLSPSCYGGRPDATRRGTDRRAALVRFRSLVRDGGLPWVAKLDIASFFDAIPHGPLLAAIRGQMASRRCEREVCAHDNHPCMLC
jgi:hypothetical protein